MGEPEASTSDRAVFTFFEAIGLMFILPPGEPLFRGEPITPRMGVFLLLGALSCAAGPAWPQLRRRLGPRFSASVARAASDFRWWLVIVLVAFVSPGLRLFTEKPSLPVWGLGIVAQLGLAFWAWTRWRQQRHMPIPEELAVEPSVSYGTPQQAAREPHLKWWHVPVGTRVGRIEDCRVYLFVNGRKVSLRWSTWQGPTEHWTLRAGEEPRDVPMIVRSEIKTVAPAAVGELEASVARVTNPNYFMGDVRNYVDLPPGLHEARVRIEAGPSGWTSPPYRIAVPLALSNLNFEMHRLSEGESALEPPDAIKSWGIEAQWRALYIEAAAPPPTAVAAPVPSAMAPSDRRDPAGASHLGPLGITKMVQELLGPVTVEKLEDAGVMWEGRSSASFGLFIYGPFCKRDGVALQYQESENSSRREPKDDDSVTSGGSGLAVLAGLAFYPTLFCIGCGGNYDLGAKPGIGTTIGEAKHRAKLIIEGRHRLS